MLSIPEILTAMRADAVPVGKCGPWYVQRRTLTLADVDLNRRLMLAGKVEPHQLFEVGTFTWLWRHTQTSALNEMPGECVMNDMPYELKKHLQFVLRARGRVLVTGLGLGCVVRGLLAVGKVESIDLVERDVNVIRLCAGSVADPRVKMHRMDAREKLPPGLWDYAWHDLWSDPDKGEPNLHTIHMKLIATLRRRVRWYGAWAMPRRFSRGLPRWVG